MFYFVTELILFVCVCACTPMRAPNVVACVCLIDVIRLTERLGQEIYFYSLYNRNESISPKCLQSLLRLLQNCMHSKELRPDALRAIFHHGPNEIYEARSSEYISKSVQKKKREIVIDLPSIYLVFISFFTFFSPVDIASSVYLGKVYA